MKNKKKVPAKKTFTLPFTNQEVTKFLKAKNPEEFSEDDLEDIDNLDRGADQVRRLFPLDHPVAQFLSEVIALCATVGEVVREKVDEQ